MRKLLFTLLILLFSVTAFGQEPVFKSANQYTIQWGAVQELENGDLIPQGEVPLYVVYRVLYGADKNTAVEVTRTTETTCVLTFVEEGRYILGIKTLRIIDGEEVAESATSWSDDPAVALNGPFGVAFYLPYKAVTGMF